MSTAVLTGLTAAAGTGVINSANNIIAPGRVIQQTAVTAGPARQSIVSNTPVAITGLSVSFTPLSATSQILIMATVSGNMPWVTSLGIYKDGAATVSTTGYTNSFQVNMQVTNYGYWTTNQDYMWQIPIYHFETASSTTARTYAVYGRSSTSYTLNINNRVSNDMASFSFMTVMEIGQ